MPGTFAWYIYVFPILCRVTVEDSIFWSEFICFYLLFRFLYCYLLVVITVVLQYISSFIFCVLLFEEIFFFRASFRWLSSIIIVRGHYKCMYFFFCFVETTKCFILATFVYSFALTPSVSISVVMYSFKRQWCFDLKGGCTQAWNSVHADPDWHCKFDGQWICGQKPSSSTGVGNLFCQEGHFTWSQHSRG